MDSGSIALFVAFAGTICLFLFSLWLNFVYFSEVALWERTILLTLKENKYFSVEAFYASALFLGKDPLDSARAMDHLKAKRKISFVDVNGKLHITLTEEATT